MDFTAFKKNLSVIKSKQLGGLEAQFKLAPAIRLAYTEEKIVARNPRKAAVMALFYPNKENKTIFLLTQRATYKGTHSAQISFPGGKLNTTDKDLETTALRETYEEVGVLPDNISIVRELTNVYIPPSNFLVTPFLGISNKRPNFITNYEVDHVFEVLLADLLTDTVQETVKLTTSYMTDFPVPCYKLNGYVVWGATAMVLSEIKELIL